MAADLNVVLSVRQRFARRDQQLRFDNVDSGDQFRHGMLDLNARVHFNEIKFVILVQEFQGAGAAVADFPDRPGATLSHGFALLGGQPGRRCFLDNLLMPALHRAIALA